MHYLFRRPALLVYSKYWFFYRIVLTTIHTLLSRFPLTGFCLYFFYRVLGFALLQPILAYNAMIFDSNWWQSGEASRSLNGGSKMLKDDDAVSSDPNNCSKDVVNKSSAAMVENISDRGTFDALNSFPKEGKDLHIQAAQTLAVVIDRIETENVIILNFAHLKFSTIVLGNGSFSKVYKGKFKGESVAIKSIYTMDLTAEVIDKLATEAKILTAIKNPNVVDIYGKFRSIIDVTLMHEFQFA